MRGRRLIPDMDEPWYFLLHSLLRPTAVPLTAASPPAPAFSSMSISSTISSHLHYAVIIIVLDHTTSKRMARFIQGVPKNIPIDPPKLQFLTYTYEISVVGRHFHRKFSAFYGFEKF